MNERRIKRLQELIKARVAEVVSFELSDPRRGLITITKVELDREVSHCKVFWSVLGGEKERKLNSKMLDHATAFVQREVAAVLHTRTVPKVHFVFDESIQGALRVQGIIDKLREERDAREAEAGDRGEGEEPGEGQANA
jgi:ribosome-binding factor A